MSSSPSAAGSLILPPFCPSEQHTGRCSQRPACPHTHNAFYLPPDPAFFARFVHLKVLRTPLHHIESPSAQRVPFSTASSGGGGPVVLPEEEKGGVAAGSYGIVFSAMDTSCTPPKKVAIKFSKMDSGAYDAYNRKEHPQIVEEVPVHMLASTLQCPSILKLLYAAEVDCNLAPVLTESHKRHAYVLEYASGHNLKDVLANHEMIGTLARVEPAASSSSSGGGGGGMGTGGAGAGAAPPPTLSDRRPYLEVDKRELFKQILVALKALHGKGITHRDIKPENIMLRHAPVVAEGDLHNLEAAKQDIHLDLAVFDFGLAIDAARGDVRSEPRGQRLYRGNIGTAQFLPPEVLERYRTEKWDLEALQALPPEVRERLQIPAQSETTCYKPPMDVFAAGVTLYLMLLGDGHMNVKYDDPRQAAAYEAALQDLVQGKAQSTWDSYRINMLPFQFVGRSLVPDMRFLPTPPSLAATNPAEAAIRAEHRKRSLFISEAAKSLLAGLLHFDPAQRLTAAEALAHPWFALTTQQLSEHASPEALERAAQVQSRVLRESRLNRLRLLGTFHGAVRLGALAEHARRHLAATRLTGAQAQALLGAFHARQQAKAAAAAAVPGAPLAPLAPSIHDAERGVSKQGLAALLQDSGVSAGGVGVVLEGLWSALAGDKGEVSESDFLILLPLLCDSGPSQALDATLGLYFDLWDVNRDGILSDQELASLMEAVHYLLPSEAGGEGEEGGEGRHAQLLVAARHFIDSHPHHAISKETFVLAVKHHRDPLAALVVPLQRL